jgi:hypothetical protein
MPGDPTPQRRRQLQLASKIPPFQKQPPAKAQTTIRAFPFSTFYPQYQMTDGKFLAMPNAEAIR